MNRKFKIILLKTEIFCNNTNINIYNNTFLIWYLRLVAADRSLVEPWMASSCCLRFVSAQGDWEPSYLLGLWKCLWITPKIRYQYNLNKAVFDISSSLIVTDKWDRPHQGWAGSDRVQTRGGQVWGRVRRRRVLWNCSWWGEEEEAGTEEESWTGLPLETLGEQRERERERLSLSTCLSNPSSHQQMELKYHSGKNVLCSDPKWRLLNCQDTFNENTGNTGHTQLYKHQTFLIVLFLMYFWINKCSIDEQKRL